AMRCWKRSAQNISNAARSKRSRIARTSRSRSGADRAVRSPVPAVLMGKKADARALLYERIRSSPPKFMHVVGVPYQVEIERSEDPEKIDHVWLTIEVPPFGLGRGERHRWPRRGDEALFSRRQRHGTLPVQVLRAAVNAGNRRWRDIVPNVPIFFMVNRPRKNGNAEDSVPPGSQKVRF